MNGRHISIQKVFDGIEAAKKAGLAIKINMVVQKGVNDQDVLPMAAYFKKKKDTFSDLLNLWMSVIRINGI
ncbi:hypothetical protein BsIDN1_64530 [Bacillus safensis]|uniref:Molybdenum cofactor biosynthesis protein A n=1 Tax=Bacillus safensis TaxID=561879 RepID=A0A5S9MJ75_BACIA|nr:hypothetical protein BsIDN1_64530 [Bacillus safensis]